MLVAWTVEVVNEVVLTPAEVEVSVAVTGQMVVYKSTITVVSWPEAPVRVLVAWTVEVVNEVVLTPADVDVSVAVTGQIVVYRSTITVVTVPEMV